MLNVREIFRKAYKYEKIKKQLDIKQKALDLQVIEMDQLRRERNGYWRGLEKLRIERRRFLRLLVRITWRNAIDADKNPPEWLVDELINEAIELWKKDQFG